VKPEAAWIQGGPVTLAGLRGKVVLIRFFMNSDCPYCRATAPSLNEFHHEFAGDGLVVIGMYTPKPRPRAVKPDEVREYVKSYGFEFPVAIDADWGALTALCSTARRRELYLGQPADRPAWDSPPHPAGRSLRQGRARPQARRDYEDMRAAIVALLAEAP